MLGSLIFTDYLKESKKNLRINSEKLNNIIAKLSSPKDIHRLIESINLIHINE